jgi:hypothetical protein
MKIQKSALSQLSAIFFFKNIYVMIVNYNRFTFVNIFLINILFISLLTKIKKKYVSKLVNISICNINADQTENKIK